MKMEERNWNRGARGGYLDFFLIRDPLHSQFILQLDILCLLLHLRPVFRKNIQKRLYSAKMAISKDKLGNTAMKLRNWFCFEWKVWEIDNFTKIYIFCSKIFVFFILLPSVVKYYDLFVISMPNFSAERSLK